jgi:hypothetical protein
MIAMERHGIQFIKSILHRRVVQRRAYVNRVRMLLRDSGIRRQGDGPDDIVTWSLVRGCDEESRLKRRHTEAIQDEENTCSSTAPWH